MAIAWSQGAWRLKRALNPEGGLLCPDALCSLVCAGHCSPVGSGILPPAVQTVPAGPAPAETLGAESLQGSPGQKHCAHVAAFLCWGEEECAL